MQKVPNDSFSADLERHSFISLVHLHVRRKYFISQIMKKKSSLKWINWKTVLWNELIEKLFYYLCVQPSVAFMFHEIFCDI